MKTFLFLSIILAMSFVTNANTKVGIGTTSPDALLDVNGDILINELTLGRGSGNRLENSALGYQASFSISSGLHNSALGCFTLFSTTYGEQNTGIGSHALFYNATGSFNNAPGFTALFNSKGSRNNGIGRGVLYNSTTGNGNTAVGDLAGLANVTGSNSLYLGAYTEVVASDLNNACAIGAHHFVSASNSMVLGSINGVNGAAVSTKVGIGTSSPVAALHVEGTFKASAWHSASMAGNGYADMGGLRMPWGTINYNSNNAVTVQFPIAFNSIYTITATVDSGNNTGSGANTPAKVMNITNNNFQIAGTAGFSGDNVSKVRWIAIGI